ncbi:low-affinity Zn(2+) transporter zrt2 [Linderina pennispora]|nr:low-affinity Zn(2+) transporter zrt2 [Linderina pennispora]
MATVDEETSTKPTKRVSLSTPPTTTKRVYNSSASEMSDSSGNVPAVGNNSRNGNAASPGGSTVIHSPGSTIADMPLPVDVKRRAMATYILEVGIALYSVLVGLALAVSDKDFTVMLVAICFHQFFEGLALGSSLAELYWIKAQLSANGWQQDPTTETDMSIPESPGGSRQEYVNVDFVDSTTFPAETVYPLPAKLPTAHKNKSHRTLISMATSFTPEPWQVNPQLERTLGEPAHGNMPGPNKAIPQQQRHQGHAVHPIRHAQDDMDGDAVLVPVGAHGSQVELSRYLQPRTTPERLPGWWKAWISGLAFTMTTPLGIVIGLAVRHVYEPHSKYALLLNGVLESICAGVLVYTGLITMVVGGFSSLQVKQFKRMFQVSLFLAVYMGAAAMASLKIWK